MQNKKVIAGCLTAVIILLIGGLGLAYFYANIPPISDQVIPGNAYIAVNLTTPLFGSSLPLNAFTRVDAEAVGQKPLQRLEFWVDSQMVSENSLPDSSNQTTASAFWTWTPPKAGNYTLVIRAYDVDGHFALSNGVQVHAELSADQMALVKYVVQNGDTLESLAQQNNTSQEAILNANPGISGQNPLPLGGSLNIPIPVPPILSLTSKNGTQTTIEGKPTQVPTLSGVESQSLTQAAPTPAPTQIATAVPAPQFGGSQNIIPDNIPVTNVTGSTFDKLTFWLTNKFTNLFGGQPKMMQDPSIPAIYGAAKGCNADLRIYSPAAPAPSVEAYLLYRLDPVSTKYKLIATLPGTSSGLLLGYLDSNLFGSFSYYVVGISGPLHKQTTSSIVSVNVTDPSCNQGQWSSLIVTQATMVTTAPMSGGIYCYITLNNNPWGRMPVTGVIPFSGGGYNLKSYFPNIALAPFPPTINVTLECWGYSGSSLVNLGKASQSFSTGNLPATVIIKGTGFTATIVFDKGSPQPGSQSAPSNLTPPTSLRNAQTVSDCTSHIPGGLTGLFGSLVCGKTVSYHYQTLIWEWKPLFCPAFGSSSCGLDNQVDGYRVYQVTSDGKMSLLEEKQGTDFKVETFPQPAKDAQGNLPCYVVRTYKGTAESVNSNLFCLPPVPPGTATLQLKPSNLYQEDVWNETFGNGLGCPGSDASPHPDFPDQVTVAPDGNIYAYYVYVWDPGADPIPCWFYSNEYAHGIINFDLSKVPGQIYSAVLNFNQSGPNDVCGQSLNLATSFAPNFIAKSVTGYESIDVLGDYANQIHNVSAAVRSWQVGHSDKTITFTINTSYEDINARQNSRCFTSYYNNFTLNVNYFTK